MHGHMNVKKNVAGSTSLALTQTSRTSNVSHCLQQKICSYISIEDSGLPGCDAAWLGKYFLVFELKQHLLYCRMVLVVALVYLSCIHLLRQIYDYGSYTLDITGMLCVDVIMYCFHAPGSTLSHLYFCHTCSRVQLGCVIQLYEEVHFSVA